MPFSPYTSLCYCLFVSLSMSFSPSLPPLSLSQSLSHSLSASTLPSLLLTTHTFLFVPTTARAHRLSTNLYVFLSLPPLTLSLRLSLSLFASTLPSLLLTYTPFLFLSSPLTLLVRLSNYLLPQVNIAVFHIMDLILTTVRKY